MQLINFGAIIPINTSRVQMNYPDATYSRFGPVSPTPISPTPVQSPIPISPTPVSPTLDIQGIPISSTLHFLFVNLFLFFFFSNLS